MPSVCAVSTCERRSRSRGWCGKHYLRWLRHGAVTTVKRFPNGTPLEVRVWAKVDRSGGPNACWPWRGARNKQGYGSIGIAGGKTIHVTHVVYELDRGHPPEYPCVLHHCDNPPCCNPRHLWAGTYLDNAHDKEQKGRGNHAVGERNGNARATEVQVREIRRRHSAGGVRQKALAQEYGLSTSTIYRIVHGGGWSSLAYST